MKIPIFGIKVTYLQTILRYTNNMQELLKILKGCRIAFNRGQITRPVLIALVLISLLLPASLISCKNNIEREDAMIQNTTIPLIDANAPTETETATFALG